MSIESNATTAAQTKYVNRVIASLGEAADDADMNIQFSKGSKEITVTIDGEEQKFNGDGFRAWVADFEKRMKDANANSKEAKKKAAEEAKAKREAEAAAEAQRKAAENAKIRAQARSELDDVLAGIASDIQNEDKGSLTTNEARYRKGMHLDHAAVIGEKLKQAEDPSFIGRGATVMKFARDQVSKMFRDLQGEASVRLGTKAVRALSNAEVSMTRKVYSTFLKHEDDGLDSTFLLVDATDRDTGEPLVGDDGEPLEVPVTRIAINKLYALSNFYRPDHKDMILSFAHRNTERAVLAAAKLLDKDQDNIVEVIGKLNELTDQANVNAKEDNDALTPEEVIKDHVAQLQGQKKPSEVKTIKVDAAFYAGDWFETKRVATAIAKACGIQLGDDGEIGNTKLLETMLGEFFAPRIHGANNLVQMFVSSGDMTDEQATSFLETYSKNESKGEDEGEDDDEGPTDAEAAAAAENASEPEDGDDDSDSDDLEGDDDFGDDEEEE